MAIKYRVILSAEDGVYILDEFYNEDMAYKALERLEPQYGEGQELYVEEEY